MPTADTNARYWSEIAAEYQEVTRISTRDFHYGPLLPGDRELGLLPVDVVDRRCLEVGCGGGQNSIALARRGAACVATDIAAGQLETARRLAAASSVHVDFRQLAMEDLASADLGTFDLVHSTYGLPFTSEPAAVIAAMAAAMRPGGMLLLTVGHPVFAGEWIELADEEKGMFLHSYFQPPPEVRFTADGEDFVRAHFWPLGRIIDWLREAGLVLNRLVEPRPLPLPTMTEAEIEARIPYESDGWRELYEQLAHIPVVAVFQAHRPEPAG